MKFVNAYQSKEERREKYQFCRDIGLSPQIARWVRDWNKSTIRRGLIEKWEVFYCATVKE